MLPIIAIINSFILSSIVSILIFGVVMNVKHTKHNIYRGFLITLFSFWAAVMLGMFVKFHADGLGAISYNFSIAGLPVTLLGIPSFFSVVSYPIVILNSQLLRVSGWLRLCSPLIIAVALYFVVSYALGLDPFVVFPTLNSLFSPETILSAILRLSLIAVFMIYIYVMLRSMWQIVPLYNNYVHDNIADSDCNVDWLHNYIKYVLGVSIAYFILLFSNSPYVNTVYLITVLLLFAYLVDMSLFHKTSEDIEALSIGWNIKDGWHVVDDAQGDKEVADIGLTQLNNIGSMIDSWMEREALYRKVDFTTKDILDAFPELNNRELGVLFKSRGENFQSYVRKYRIEKACEIIESSRDSIYPKQIFGLVGYSHYSSFSRSFLAAKGVTPSEYIKQRH